MWTEIYADFLGVDICNVVMSEYTNPKQVLNSCENGNKSMLKEVLGKVINKYKNWSGFTIDDILNSGALKIAISYALDSYHWRTKA